MSSPNITVTNIVATSKIRSQIDLEQLTTTCNANEFDTTLAAEHDPFLAIHLAVVRLKEPKTAVTVPYNFNVDNTAGASTEKETIAKKDDSSVFGDFYDSDNSDDTAQSNDENNARAVFEELNDFLLTGKDMANSIPDKKEGEFTKVEDEEKTIVNIANPEHPIDDLIVNTDKG